MTVIALVTGSVEAWAAAACDTLFEITNQNSAVSNPVPAGFRREPADAVGDQL